jgi:spore maturation protein CgeB
MPVAPAGCFVCHGKCPMRITPKTKFLILFDTPKGGYGHQYAYDCVPRIVGEMGYIVRILGATNMTFDSYRQTVSDFGPDMIFCFLQQPLEVIKVAGFLKDYRPAPAVNWYLEDPNGVVSGGNGTHILDATACFDYWFSQDAGMQRFWKTRSAFMPPAFDDSIYKDYELERVYDVSYIGRLGPSYVTEMYWPYMKELAQYGERAMMCVDRPMGIPLLPKPLEKFIRSKKRRKFLQSLPFWKCCWTNPADEKEKCYIINQSKIHFGMVRLRGEWETAFRQLLPDYPLDKHGLFYQLKGRLFQAVGAGAMALNEYCPELEELFEIGKEIITFEFGNVEEVREKLLWYLAHDAERQRIARAGYERGRKHHTFTARIQQIFDIVQKEL